MDLKQLAKIIKSKMIKKGSYQVTEAVTVPIGMKESILKEVEQIKNKDDIKEIKKVLNDVKDIIDKYYY
jgi:hypothetical protein